MNRCAICDYVEGHGSSWLSKGADKRRVIWRTSHKEYQCDDCFVTIRNTRVEQEVEDALKALNKPHEETSEHTSEVEVCQDEFALPEVLL